jgi:SRSO17 transposase
MLPGERKSVEPMAARVCPENVRSAHQSMHHLVAAADWDDRAVLAAVAQQVVAELLKKDEPEALAKMRPDMLVKSSPIRLQDFAQ